jgi:hypothetical protein
MFATGDHVLVSTPWGYVDPSYGLPENITAYTTVAQYERIAIAGFAVVYYRNGKELIPLPRTELARCEKVQCVFRAVPYS